MYSVEYINCKVCGSDKPKFLGIRGNKEYAGAADKICREEHIVTNVVRCRKCGFVYTNPLIKSKIDCYNDPDNYFSSSNLDPEVLFGFILDLIEKKVPKGKILDVGCGKGEFLSLARKRGWQIYGLEPSSNFAKAASERCGININSVSLKEAAYPDNFFDVVALNMALEHVDEPQDFLKEISRVLRKKGLLFVEVPNTDSLMLKIASLYFKIKGRNWSPLLSPLHHPFHSYGYNPRSIKFLLDSRNFKIDKLLICDSALRGFRTDSGGQCLENIFRNFVTKLGGFFGKGDVLMVIAKKE